VSELVTVRPSSLPPKGVIKVANIFVRLLLRSPLHGLMSAQMVLLTYTGRKSGKPYCIPVGYRREGHMVTVAAGNPWWVNVRGGAPVTLRIAGEQLRGIAVPVEDKVAAEGYLMDLVRGMPKFAKTYHASLMPDGQPDPASIKKAVNLTVIVRVTLA